MDLRYYPIKTNPIVWRNFNLNFGTRTFIMGILNITPDSFSDGGEFIGVDNAIKHASEMIEEGADIIDVGGESTRPGSEVISEAEEICRVVPFIKSYKSQFTIPLSLDTSKSKVGLAGSVKGSSCYLK